MAAKLKTKRTSITTMEAKIQAFDIFQTPLNSHYPLPLILVLADVSSVIEMHVREYCTGMTVTE